MTHIEIKREVNSENVKDVTSWALECLKLPEAKGQLVFLKKWIDPKGRATGFLARWGRPDLNVSGGGIRMKVYETVEEAAEEAMGLAATMSEKFGIAGPEINGSKFVIFHDPNSSDKKEILSDFVQAFLADLQNVGTAGDLNVSEQETAEVLGPLGIDNPQWGILNSLSIGDRQARLTGVMNIPLAEPMSEKHKILVDVTAGWSTYSAIEAYFKELGEDLSGKTIALQGIGAVGGSAGYYLERAGAKVVVAADRNGSFRVAGSFAEVLCQIDPHTGCIPRTEKVEEIGDTQEVLYQDVDILVVAAASGVITEENASRITAPVIFEGANRPTTKVAEKILSERGIKVFPDFIVNAGTAELFTIGMLGQGNIEETAVLGDIKKITENATREVIKLSESEGISFRGAAKVVSTQNLWKKVLLNGQL